VGGVIVMDDVRVSHAELLRFVTAIFSTTGVSTSDAATMAEVLVWANARGIDSHGVVRLPIYLNEIKTGKLNPTAQPVTRQLLPATFMMECNRAPGAVCMMRAAALAVDVAQKLGVGVGLLSNPHHLGAIGRYAQWVAERGFAALVILAGLPFMAYHGAKGASIGTSPIAIGIPGPTSGDTALLFDMSTSVKAAGLIHQAAIEGQSIPEGLAIDAEGRLTTDPSQAVAVLPLGGAKGSGLALMFECLTGILAGTPIIAPLARTGGAKAAQNAMIIVFDIANFRPSADYRRDVQELAETVKALPLRDGFDELLLPGERGDREAKRRRSAGVPLPEKLRVDLDNIAQELGVAKLGAE
jgi:LDH2 family malate/lactate/ureidoglycolate dehydrogenase